MIGRDLRETRQKLHLTQEELAFKAGISRNYISLLELDQKSPTLDVLARICFSLGVRMSDLISAAEKREAVRQS